MGNFEPVGYCSTCWVLAGVTFERRVVATAQERARLADRIWTALVAAGVVGKKPDACKGTHAIMTVLP